MAHQNGSEMTNLHQTATRTNAAGRPVLATAQVDVDTIEDLLETATLYALDCLFQRCEQAITNEKEFKLTTGSSALDKHSAVRWARIAQKYHLLDAQRRCERFLCENFHLILDDPVLQDLTRPSLLRMLRAQSAMVSVYRNHMEFHQEMLQASATRFEQKRGKRRRADAAAETEPADGPTDGPGSLELSSSYDSQFDSDLLVSSDLLSNGETPGETSSALMDEHDCPEELQSTAQSRPDPHARDHKVLDAESKVVLKRCWSSPAFKPATM